MCEDTRGNNALVLSIVLRRLDVIALLVAHGCEPLKRNQDNNSALHFLGEVLLLCMGVFSARIQGVSSLGFCFVDAVFCRSPSHEVAGSRLEKNRLRTTGEQRAHAAPHGCRCKQSRCHATHAATRERRRQRL